jgi:spore maturation protein SpmA
MNVIFYALVAISVLVGALRGDASHEARSQAQEVHVEVDSDSPVKADSEAWVSANAGAPVRAKVTKREGTSVVVQLAASGPTAAAAPLPDGDLSVRFPEEYPATRMGKGALKAAEKSVSLAIELAGAMILFMGLVKVFEAGGGMQAVARAIRPLLVRLFPDVPANHPAMGAIVLNLAANVMGLGNAATPFGIKAMQELDKLNPVKGRATNAMILFLAINTSGVAVLPTGVMAMRAAAGSSDPAAIFLPTLLATSCSTLSAVAVCLLLHRFRSTPEDALPAPPEALADLPPAEPDPGWRGFLPLLAAFASVTALVVGVYRTKDLTSAWIIPGLIFGMLSYGVIKKVKVYETFLEGAKDGFNSAIRITPFLVAVLSAVAMFRESGALGAVVNVLRPFCEAVGMPPETLPLALLRPLSGSGATALTAELTTTYGPDTLIGQVAGTLQGSTETTFYVLAVYFGAVGIHRTRHAAGVGLVADVMGAVGTLLAVHLLL